MKYTSCSAENGTFIDLRLGCSRCGYSVNSNDNFCPHCGKELQSLRTTIPFRDIVDILNERFRPTKAKDATEDIKPKTKTTDSCIDTRTRNCDRFNTGDAESDYATALKKYRAETGKVVCNATPGVNSVGDFIIWMMSGKSLDNGTVDGALHNDGKDPE